MNNISKHTCVEHSNVTVWAIITLSTGKLSSSSGCFGSDAFQNCRPIIENSIAVSSLVK